MTIVWIIVPLMTATVLIWRSKVQSDQALWLVVAGVMIGWATTSLLEALAKFAPLAMQLVSKW